MSNLRPDAATAIGYAGLCSHLILEWITVAGAWVDVPAQLKRGGAGKGPETLSAGILVAALPKTACTAQLVLACTHVAQAVAGYARGVPLETLAQAEDGLTLAQQLVSAAAELPDSANAARAPGAASTTLELSVAQAEAARAKWATKLKREVLTDAELAGAIRTAHPLADVLHDGLALILAVCRALTHAVGTALASAAADAAPNSARSEHTFLTKPPASPRQPAAQATAAPFSVAMDAIKRACPGQVGESMAAIATVYGMPKQRADAPPAQIRVRVRKVVSGTGLHVAPAWRTSTSTSAPLMASLFASACTHFEVDKSSHVLVWMGQALPADATAASLAAHAVPTIQALASSSAAPAGGAGDADGGSKHSTPATSPRAAGVRQALQNAGLRVRYGSMEVWLVPTPTWSDVMRTAARRGLAPAGKPKGAKPGAASSTSRVQGSMTSSLTSNSSTRAARAAAVQDARSSSSMSGSATVPNLHSHDSVGAKQSATDGRVRLSPLRPRRRAGGTTSKIPLPNAPMAWADLSPRQRLALLPTPAPAGGADLDSSSLVLENVARLGALPSRHRLAALQRGSTSSSQSQRPQQSLLKTPRHVNLEKFDGDKPARRRAARDDQRSSSPELAVHAAAAGTSPPRAGRRAYRSQYGQAAQTAHRKRIAATRKQRAQQRTAHRTPSISPLRTPVAQSDIADSPQSKQSSVKPARHRSRSPAAARGPGDGARPSTQQRMERGLAASLNKALPALESAVKVANELSAAVQEARAAMRPAAVTPGATPESSPGTSPTATSTERLQALLENVGALQHALKQVNTTTAAQLRIVERLSTAGERSLLRRGMGSSDARIAASPQRARAARTKNSPSPLRAGRTRKPRVAGKRGARRAVPVSDSHASRSNSRQQEQGSVTPVTGNGPRPDALSLGNAEHAEAQTQQPQAVRSPPSPVPDVQLEPASSGSPGAPKSMLLARSRGSRSLPTAGSARGDASPGKQPAAAAATSAEESKHDSKLGESSSISGMST